MTDLPARRYKLPSEYDTIDREQVAQFGASDRVERAEYIKARRNLLADPEADPALLERLAREEAEALEADAGRLRTKMLERRTVQDEFQRMQARNTGAEPPEIDGEAAAVKRIEARLSEAAKLAARADELAQYRAEHDERPSVEDHANAMRSSR